LRKKESPKRIKHSHLPLFYEEWELINPFEIQFCNVKVDNFGLGTIPAGEEFELVSLNFDHMILTFYRDGFYVSHKFELGMYVSRELDPDF
jgi:hypothetical protein